MGRSVTSGSSDSIATVAGLDDVVYSTFNGTVFEATAPYDVYTGKERYLVLSLDLAGDLVSNAPTWNVLSTLTDNASTDPRPRSICHLYAPWNVFV
jgi:hypothetical protein